MKLPRETPLMILPNVTLFPQAMLPLYIFEPRYRKMLTDALDTNRMFAIAMQKPGAKREMPSPVVGIGLIRVAVRHRDGTSHLILQGAARMELGETVRYKPYRVQRVNPIPSAPGDTVAVDALLVKVRELIAERIELGIPFPFPVLASATNEPTQAPPQISPQDMLEFLDAIKDPAQAADMVSCATLPGGRERQAILEAVDVETRLRRLIGYLIAEIRKKKSS
ncbi:MAG TPA: LON peptidase substrate-binding domain-containing protein [Verrucomicrobiae bacterium]|nr:LON peptidase substrate-binding domain-containing protein [Verrucomicrobiae bacterium]